jgi:hypothetical protein
MAYTKDELRIIDNLFKLDADMIEFKIINNKLTIDKIIKKKFKYVKFDDIMIFDFNKKDYEELSREKMNDEYDLVYLTKQIIIDNVKHNHIICDIQKNDLLEMYNIDTNNNIIHNLVKSFHEKMFGIIDLNEDNYQTNIANGELNNINYRGSLRKIIDIQIESSCIFCYGTKLILYDNTILNNKINIYNGMFLLNDMCFL